MRPPPPVGGYGPNDPTPIRPYLRGARPEQVPPVPERPEELPTEHHTPSEQPPSASATGLRPFVLTSGRVDAVDPDISLETQVTVHYGGGRVPTSRLAPELRAIVTLCGEPLSVAEISARLHLHLGVVKVLVGDLRATGYLDVHTMSAEIPDKPELILRVIRGLSAIA